MNKIKVFRASGNPIREDHVTEAMEKHRAFYDKILKKYKLDEKTQLSQELSLKLEKTFKRYEGMLKKRYPVETEWDFVDSREKWNEIVKQYGNIAISRNRETDDIVYIILDVQF